MSATVELVWWSRDLPQTAWFAASRAACAEAAGLRVLLDDRDSVSPGVKFKDAELIGVPTIVVIGRGIGDGLVEVKDRKTGERDDVPVADAVARLVEL